MKAPALGDIRSEVWNALLKAKAAAYPLPPYGHHPNFVGAKQASDLLLDYLFETGLLQAADTVLCYPDNVLRPVRQGLLERGVSVVVPAKYGKSYRLLEAGKVTAAEVSSIAGAEKDGKLLSDLPRLKMALLACVALNQDGYVLNKGYGFQLPGACAKLATATILHPVQVVSHSFTAPLQVKLYATPEKVSNLSAESAKIL